MADPTNAPSPAEPAGQAPPGGDSRVQVHHLVTIAVWLLGFLLFFFFFEAVRMVLLGFLAAASLASALKPLAWRLPGPRSLKALLAGAVPPLVLATLIFLTLWLVAAPLKQQLGQWPQMEQHINGVLAQWSGRLGLHDPLDVKEIVSRLGRVLVGGGSKGLVSSATGFVSGFVIALAFIFLGSIYILLESPGRLLTPILKMLPARRRAPARAAIDDLGPRLRWWLIGTLIGSLVIGVASWLGYFLVGLKFALPLALLAGIGEIIPNVGPLITFLVALVFASAQGGGTVLGVGLVYLVIQGLESHVLMPLIMKKAVDIPPLVTLFTLVLWGRIFGLPGLLLAIPINLTLWSFAEHFLIEPDEPESSNQ